MRTSADDDAYQLSANANAEKSSKPASQPDDGENITVRNPRRSVGDVRPRNATGGILSTITEHPEASGAADRGDDGGESALVAPPKKRRRTVHETPAEHAEGKAAIFQAPKDNDTDTHVDVEDDDAPASPKKAKLAKGKGKATKRKP